jgi:hypothetical protein
VSIRLHGVLLLSANEFNESDSFADSLVLVIGTDSRMKKHTRNFSTAKHDNTVVVVCGEDDAHLVPAIRLPQIILLRGGEIQRRVHITLDPASVDDALEHLHLR